MPASAGEKVGVLGCLARAEGARDSDGWTRAGGKPRALCRVCQRGVVGERSEGCFLGAAEEETQGAGPGRGRFAASAGAAQVKTRVSPSRSVLAQDPRGRRDRGGRKTRAPAPRTVRRTFREPRVGCRPDPAGRASAATPPTSKPQPVQTPLPAAPRGASCGRRRVRPRGRASSVGATRLRRARELRSAGLGSHVHRRTRPPPRTALRVSRGP